MLQTLRNALVAPPAQLTDGRKSVRYDISEACQVERWGRMYEATTRNLSKGGIALDILGMGSSAMDAELKIYLRDFSPIVARARWSHKRTFGLQFLTDSEDHPGITALLRSLSAES